MFVLVVNGYRWWKKRLGIPPLGACWAADAPNDKKQKQKASGSL
jgi:hypothetical protein